MTYDNKNSGVLFKQEEKKGDTDRDYGGRIDFDGDEYWLSGLASEDSKELRLSYSAKDGGPALSGRGVLRVNENRPKDTHPNFKGEVEYDGNTLQIAAWKREAKSSGKQFLSIKIDDKSSDKRPAESKPEPVAAGRTYSDKAPEAQSSFLNDDEIPF